MVTSQLAVPGNLLIHVLGSTFVARKGLGFAATHRDWVTSVTNLGDEGECQRSRLISVALNAVPCDDVPKADPARAQLGWCR